VRQLIIY